MTPCLSINLSRSVCVHLNAEEVCAYILVNLLSSQLSQYLLYDAQIYEHLSAHNYAGKSTNLQCLSKYGCTAWCYSCYRKQVKIMMTIERSFPWGVPCLCNEWILKFSPWILWLKKFFLRFHVAYVFRQAFGV